MKKDADNDEGTVMMAFPRYQSGPLDMMNLSEGRAPHEAITRVKQLEAVSIITFVIVIVKSSQDHESNPIP